MNSQNRLYILGNNYYKESLMGKVRPFLSWPGGKKWFVRNYEHLLPNEFNTYIEPFLGSGSVFFHLNPEMSILGDLNEELVNVYKSIRGNWRSVYKELRIHDKKHSPEYYYEIRKKKYRSNFKKAARIIYLNRTCFNGIYRVNKKGEFNVPIGSKNKVILEHDNFEKISDYLYNTQLYNNDFEILVNNAVRDDFIFIDPPYTVRHNNNGFISYNEKLFSLEDQERLAASVIRAKDRGVKILLTNANHELIRGLYSDEDFTQIQVSRYSSISGLAKSRKQYSELIIKANY